MCHETVVLRPHSIEAKMAMRRTLFAAIVASIPTAMPALAQPAQNSAVAANPIDQPTTTPTNSASLTHSAVKATTFKIGSTATNLAILSYATGDVIGGAALTAFMLGSSWVIYTGNDYLWDSYSPPPTKQTGSEAFDATADVWRNTGKFLTYKPVVASIKLASLYVYTGSAAVATIFGTASILTNTAVFYVNNVAWDFYDWYAAAPVTVTTAETQSASTGKLR
jgi:uncharacterized membrane protein